MDTPWSEPAPFIPESRCDHYRNISELESRISSPAVIFESPPVAGNLVARQPESRCPYTLSAGLFLALDEHLGADAFVSAVANLARERTGLICEERGIDDVRLVFADYGKEALNIIDLWYEGNHKMLFYTHNNSIDWETAPTVTSTGELVMVGYAELGSMFTDRQDNYCSQFELVDPSNRYSYSLLVLQRRFLSLVSFGVKIALLDPMPQSCQGCGVIAKKWFQIPFPTNRRCNTRKPTVIVGHLAALVEFKGRALACSFDSLTLHKVSVELYHCATLLDAGPNGGYRRQARTCGGQRLAFGHHQVLQLEANMGRSCRRVGAAVL